MSRTALVPRSRHGCGGRIVLLTALLWGLFVSAVPGQDPPAAHAVANGRVAPNGRAAADSVFTPQYEPKLAVTRAAGSIRIDGDLTDDGWRGVARAAGFSEHSPGNMTRPPVESEVWVTYDDNNFYMAFIAYDDPASVRVSMCERDAIFRDDYCGILLDTYGDFTWAYELFVNPLGIQGDLRMAASGDEDIGFDIVWYSKGRVTDRGYQVEIAIPFSSLRFPDRDEQVWRLNFWRDHQRETRRRYTWAATHREEPCWMCQWGTLTGIRGIRPRTNVDLIASAVGQQVGSRPMSADGLDPHQPFDMQDPEGRLSLNARYGLSSCSSAELAINPDFSQIESDVGQIDVNTTFALAYPERRPFFQEGSDLYSTLLDVIYTRSINDPQVAGKFTGTYGRTSLLYLAARDRNTPVLIPGEEASYQPLRENGFRDIRSISNLFRLRRALLEDSRVGLTVTDRRLQEGIDGSGTVFSLDAFVRFLTNYNIDLQALASHTQEPNDTLMTRGLNAIKIDEGRHTLAFDGESFWGRGLFFGVQRNGRVSGTSTSYLEIGPTFRADNGYFAENGYRRVLFNQWLSFQPNRRWLVQWSASCQATRKWSTTGEFKRDQLAPEISCTLPGQTEVSLEATAWRERFAGRRFDHLLSRALSLETRPLHSLTIDSYVARSRTIVRTTENPRLGNALDVSVAASLRPLSRLTIDPQIAYFRLDERHGGPNIYKGTIWRGRMSFQFTREFDARMVVQYDTFDKRLNIEPLLTYRVNPFTVCYLGATSSQLEFPAGAGATGDCPCGGLPEARWKPVDRQYFAKIQYLWRI
jgi:hypothetical protein